jgi:hypothetical protein
MGEEEQMYAGSQECEICNLLDAFPSMFQEFDGSDI